MKKIRLYNIVIWTMYVVRRKRHKFGKHIFLFASELHKNCKFNHRAPIVLSKMKNIIQTVVTL